MSAFVRSLHAPAATIASCTIPSATSAAARHFATIRRQFAPNSPAEFLCVEPLASSDSTGSDDGGDSRWPPRGLFDPSDVWSAPPLLTTALDGELQSDKSSQQSDSDSEWQVVEMLTMAAVTEPPTTVTGSR